MPGLQSVELFNGPITGDNGGDLKDKRGEIGDSYGSVPEDSELPSRELRHFLERKGYTPRKAKMVANTVEDFFLREGIKISGDSHSTSSDEDVPESATKLEESLSHSP